MRSGITFHSEVGRQNHFSQFSFVGLFLYGNGQASNLLARYAATDLALPEHRGRAMSRIVFASTFGAVFGPLLVGPAEHFGQTWFGFHKYTGPWLRRRSSSCSPPPTR